MLLFRKMEINNERIYNGIPIEFKYDRIIFIMRLISLDFRTQWHVFKGSVGLVSG